MTAVKVNTYFAIILIAITGAGATWLIVRAINSTYLTTVTIGSEGNYSALQSSILKQSVN